MYKERRPLDPDFLERYEREATWAPAQGITYRTSKRYRDKGMPFLMWGGCVYIPKAEASEWIAGRIQRRNPPRRRRQATSAAEISAS
jgi:hypothetical protein